MGIHPRLLPHCRRRARSLALGADLKNTVTLVVGGQAFVSQHIGDLQHYQSLRAFRETVYDLVRMYDVPWDELLLVHDCHPQYDSSAFASELSVPDTMAVQHHRAHVASVLAEFGEGCVRKTNENSSCCTKDGGRPSEVAL